MADSETVTETDPQEFETDYDKAFAAGTPGDESPVVEDDPPQPSAQTGEGETENGPDPEEEKAEPDTTDAKAHDSEVAPAQEGHELHKDVQQLQERFAAYERAMLKNKQDPNDKHEREVEKTRSRLQELIERNEDADMASDPTADIKTVAGEVEGYRKATDDQVSTLTRRMEALEVQTARQQMDNHRLAFERDHPDLDYNRIIDAAAKEYETSIKDIPADQLTPAWQSHERRKAWERAVSQTEPQKQPDPPKEKERKPPTTMRSKADIAREMPKEVDWDDVFVRGNV